MKTYKLNEIENKRILGRNVASPCENGKPLALFWSASTLELNVKSNEVWVLLSSDYDGNEPWVAVEINNSQISRFMVPKGEPTWHCISHNMNPEREFDIKIIKDTQAIPDDKHHSLFIHEIGLSDTGSFCTLPKRDLNLEFIGDSITSGEGLVGAIDEQDWITQWLCGSKTYAIQTAKALNANYTVMSLCGWGICWAWDGNINCNMPAHYKQVCSVAQGEYEESLGCKDSYSPKEPVDYVIVNLGTNDNGAFAQPAWKDENGKEYALHLDEKGKAVEKDGLLITTGVKNFLKQIREVNPDAKIIWVYGMIRMTFIPEYILKGIEEYKAETKDEKVYSLVLDSMEEVETKEDEKGSRGHPGPKTHKLAAEKIVDFIKNLK